MINQISTQNLNAKSPFSDFKSVKNGYYFAVSKILPDSEEEKKKRSAKLGLTIAASSLLVGFGLLAAARGFVPKGLGRHLEKAKLHIEQKLAKLKFDKAVPEIEEFYNYLIKKINSFARKTESINNFASVKDNWFKRLMSKNKYTEKAHLKITNVFENVGHNTILNAYGNSNKKISKLYGKLDNVNDELLKKNPGKEVTINGITKKVKDWVDVIKTRYSSIENNYREGFGNSARTGRYKDMQEAAVDLEKFFNDKKRWKDYQKDGITNSFMADKFMNNYKVNIQNSAKKFKKRITNNINDNYNATMDSLKSIKDAIRPKDKTSRDIIRELQLNMDSYKKLAGHTEIAERNKLNEVITNNLNKLTENLNKSSKEFKYSFDYTKQIKEINNIIKSDKGELQEIMTVYRHLLDDKNYSKVKKSINSAAKTFDKAVTKETDQFVDMKRDLQLGSAPTDVLSIVGSVGTAAWGVSRADNKDERISISLKYGIPVVGAVATSLFCTASLIAGTKSMLIGMVSGLLMNKVGSAVDDGRKKFKIQVQKLKDQI